MTQAQLIPLITIVLIVLVVGLRIWLMSREQRFKPGGMWVLPIIFALFTVWLIVTEGLTSPSDIALIVAALGVGFGIGWYQGTHTTVRVDHAAHAMYVKISPLGSLIWIGVILLRIGVRYVSGNFPPSAAISDPQTPMAAAGGPAGLISMILLVLAVGVIVGLRAYLQRVYALERAAL
jgi:hypothetical protein